MKERKLVTVRSVSTIRAIPGADAIECATVDGWEVVVKRGEFEAGQQGVYFEIDSFLPTDEPRLAFLAKNGTKVFNGKIGVRLRTIKLRGQISQGLLLPISQFPELASGRCGDNTLWRVARRNLIPEALTALGRNMALQGELMGPGIQGNPEKLKDQEFYLFDIFDIDVGEYLSLKDRLKAIEELKAHGAKIEHVPVEAVMMAGPPMRRYGN